MADYEISKLMWMGIVISLAMGVFAVAQPNIPALASGALANVRNIVDGTKTTGGATNNKSIPDLDVGHNNAGDISAWNATPTSALADVKAMNLNTVSIPIRVNIPSVTSTEATVDQASADNAVAIAKTMIANGIKVIIEPYPFIDNGAGIETALQPTDEAAFMTNWSKAVTDIASQVKGLDVKGMYIGSNFTNLEDHSDAFDKLINELRPIFKGKLIYRTNWWYNATWDAATTQAFEEKKQTPFFKNVDMLSIAAYFEVSDPDEMDVNKLKAQLSNTTVFNRGQNIIGQIEDLHKATGKPIMFGELGITNYVGAMSKPYAFQFGDNAVKNDMIQSVWYRAWIETMNQYDWFKGYSVFAIGDKVSEFYPNAKAQETLKKLNKNAD